MLRVAVVGMGLMGTLHARILQRLCGVEVVGAVDVDAARLAEVGQVLGVSTFRSLPEVIDGADAVCVTLPDELHVEACVLALQRGKYVLVEKPLAPNEADARRILDAQVAPGRLMVGHLLRFDLRLLELKRRMAAGHFGQVDFVRIHRANTRGGVARLGGRVSVSAFLGVHDLDLLLWLTDARVARASARGRKVFTGQWDVVLAHLDLDNGILASVENHWLIHDALARSCIAGLQVFGTKGTAVLDLSTDELEVATDELGATRRVDSRNWTHDGGITGGSLRRELEAFVECARGGVPVPVTGEDALRAVLAVDLIEASLRCGHAVEARPHG